jgi:hypothetical protein
MRENFSESRMRFYTKQAGCWLTGDAELVCRRVAGDARACQCSESLCNSMGIPKEAMSYVFIRIIRFYIFVFYSVLSV